MYGVTFPLGDSVMRTKNPMFDITLGNMPPSHACARALNDSVSVALDDRDATKSPTRDFRMLGGARYVETLLVDNSYEVWALPGRPVQEGRYHWRMGVCLGLLANGYGANYMEPTPPALCDAGAALGQAKSWGLLLPPDRRSIARPCVLIPASDTPAWDAEALRRRSPPVTSAAASLSAWRAKRQGGDRGRKNTWHRQPT